VYRQKQSEKFHAFNLSQSSVFSSYRKTKKISVQSSVRIEKQFQFRFYLFYETINRFSRNKMPLNIMLELN
jgi:hypothetical protein